MRIFLGIVIYTETLYKAKHVLNKTDLKSLYLAFFQSYLNYGNIT